MSRGMGVQGRRWVKRWRRKGRGVRNMVFFVLFCSAAGGLVGWFGWLMDRGISSTS